MKALRKIRVFLKESNYNLYYKSNNIKKRRQQNLLTKAKKVLSQKTTKVKYLTYFLHIVYY